MGEAGLRVLAAMSPLCPLSTLTTLAGCDNQSQNGRKLWEFFFIIPFLLSFLPLFPLSSFQISPNPFLRSCMFLSILFLFPLDLCPSYLVFLCCSLSRHLSLSSCHHILVLGQFRHSPSLGDLVSLHLCRLLLLLSLFASVHLLESPSVWIHSPPFLTVSPSLPSLLS